VAETKQEIINALLRVRRHFSTPCAGGVPSLRIQRRIYDVKLALDFVKSLPEEKPSLMVGVELPKTAPLNCHACPTMIPDAKVGEPIPAGWTYGSHPDKPSCYYCPACSVLNEEQP